jgi:predicted nucleic acid-binding protein
MRIADTCERQRNRASVADVLIAAVAEAHDLVVVTRNVSDFAKTAVPILNPWTGERFNGV